MEIPTQRKKTKPVFFGGVQVGGDAPVVVQSMTCTDTRNVAATVDQIKQLKEAGCEIVRVAVPDEEAARALSDIRKHIDIPLIADIHFNYRLALDAIMHGVEGIRVNPGNIAGDKMLEVVAAAKARGTVIRIGINAGSLEKDLLKKYGGPTASALVESAMNNLALVLDAGHEAIKLSVKSSDVSTMVEAYRELSRTD